MPEVDDAFQDMSVPIPEGVEEETETGPIPPEAAHTEAPPSKPKIDFYEGVLGITEKMVYTRAGLPATVAAQIEDKASRKLVANMLEMLGVPKLHTEGLSPTARLGIGALILGGYGYLLYSQAKMLRQSLIAQKTAAKVQLHPQGQAPTMKPEDRHEHKIPNSGGRPPGEAGQRSSTGPGPGSI